MLLRIFTEPQQGASYADQLGLARKAEECGFDAYFRSDHYLAMGDGDGLPGPTDSWITLAGLARETSRIRLGTLVSSATFRNPGVLAISVAQVDQMSGGRVELGLGAGWFRAEHEAYGIEFPEMGERFDRLAEQLELICGLWETPIGQRYAFAGKHYTIVDSPALPKPVQEPRPPVIIGGAGKKRTPALAAKFATEYNANFQPLDETAVRFDRVRAACVAAGRDPRTLALSVAHTTVVGRDDAEVRRRLDAAGIDRDIARDSSLVGTPAEIVDRLSRYREIGADRAYLQVRDFADLEQLELIAAEVMPHIAD
jgi:F420-dependent oxidoreductase-like protein